MRSVIQIWLSQGRWEQHVEVALAAVVSVTVVANVDSSGLIVSAGSNISVQPDHSWFRSQRNIKIYFNLWIRTAVNCGLCGLQSVHMVLLESAHFPHPLCKWAVQGSSLSLTDLHRRLVNKHLIATMFAACIPVAVFQTSSYNCPNFELFLQHVISMTTVYYSTLFEHSLAQLAVYSSLLCLIGSPWPR